MIVGVLTLEFFLEYSHSLKEKRRFINSFTDRLKHRYNVSVSEIAFQESWQRTVLAVATVNSQQAVVQQVLNRILDEARATSEALLSGHQLNYY
ncbi:MAG: YlxP-like protein [Candidatus Saccharicenans subterraneus]|uniref:YlxP-like protein n=1 Tax=Candidatus Saccharicenans subterraneus TaxID=2508984 RepID=A0A3E2BJ91_9BACT|nr:MAG: YlxP-like protein [Candidatus Saccharicenans subterraneum]